MFWQGIKILNPDNRSPARRGAVGAHRHFAPVDIKNSGKLLKHRRAYLGIIYIAVNCDVAAVPGAESVTEIGISRPVLQFGSGSVARLPLAEAHDAPQGVFHARDLAAGFLHAQQGADALQIRI